MIKALIGGIAVGMANIIPGVSGGTMMVIIGIFNNVMDAISGLFTKDKEKLKKHILFLVALALGAVIGLVAFANLLEFLFENYPTQTLFCFVGMVAFSIPILKKKEMKEDKFKIIPFVIGCAIIFTISYFAPIQEDLVITNFPAIDFLYLGKMVLLGIVAGGAMFLPGISGSMLLLILGEYYLFKSLVAEVTSFESIVLIPLAFMAVGIISGIVISSKLTSYFLNKNHQFTMNLILGLVVASSIALIPFNAEYDLMIIITSIVALLFGGAIIILMDKFS